MRDGKDAAIAVLKEMATYQERMKRLSADLHEAEKTYEEAQEKLKRAQMEVINAVAGAIDDAANVFLNLQIALEKAMEKDEAA